MKNNTNKEITVEGCPISFLLTAASCVYVFKEDSRMTQAEYQADVKEKQRLGTTAEY